MWNWLNELFEIVDNRRERRSVCQSCEVLKMENARLIQDNTRLINKIFEKPAPEPVKEVEPVKTFPTSIPWRVRRQMLEAEDREKAKLLTTAPKPIDTEDLEKELGVSEQLRVNEGTRNAPK